MHRMKTIARRWPLLLFVLVILFSGFTAYHYANHILDSDTASELVLGKLLADENKIVTSDWLYGNEIRMFGINLIYIPLFKIIDSWHTIRFLSILILQASLALSYLYLCRRIKINLNVYFISTSLMLLPTSVVYGRMGLYHNHYIPCFIFGFLIVGLYLSYLEHRGQNSLWQNLRLTAMLLLSIMSCMNGFRQFPATMIPLFITTVVTAFMEQRNTPSSLADIPRQNWTRIGLAGAIFVAGAAGLYIHTYVLSQYFTSILKNTSIIALPTVENLRNLLVGYLSLFGFQEGRDLFSTGGILALGGVFAAIVLLVTSLQDIVARKQSSNSSGSFIAAFYPVAMLCMTATFLLLLGNENYPQYYLPAFIWVFPYLGLQLHPLPVSLRHITFRQAIILLACLCMLVNGLYYNRYYLNPNGKQITYDTRIDIHTMDRLEGAVRFIENNGLDVGYAEFWDASVTTEATDGRTTMIPLSFDTTNLVISYYYVLTNLLYREKSVVEGKSVFLLLSKRFYDFFNSTDLAQRVTLAYEDAYYRIYFFDSSTSVWEYLNQ